MSVQFEGYLMKFDTQNKLGTLGGFVGRLAAERNKTIIAFCLVTVMGLMWVRVLTGRKTTTSARAEFGQMQTATAVQSEPPRSRLVYIELPNVKGRNDMLVRDFFTVNQWETFIANRGGGDTLGKEVSMKVGTAGQEHFDKETILQVAKLLTLTVIEVGERPQAFINDTLLTVGEKLLVAHEGTSYEFTITGIHGNEVLLNCQGVNIEIKLLQPD
jgi:hypothetical protein